MKKIVLSIVLAFLVVLSAAHALVDINESSVYFTGNNKEAFTTKTQSVPFTGIITITNNFTNTVATRFAMGELVHESDISSKINITNQFLQFNANETKAVEIRVASVRDVEAGMYNGVLQLVNDTNPSQVFDSVNVKVLVPALEVTSIDVKDKESGLGDTKLEKGQKFTVTVNYKNLADLTDLENLNVRVGVYEGSDDKLTTLVRNIDGDDLESDEDVSDLNNGKSADVTFDFEMPFDMNDKDKFTVFAEITGDSQDTSSTFYARKTKEIASTVPDHKIEITKALASPSSVACGVNRVKFATEIRNIGDSREQVQLFLRNAATGSEKLLNGGEDVELDNKFENEEDFTQGVDEFVQLTDLKEGLNTYTIFAYYNDGDSVAQRDVPVTLLSCNPTTTTTTNTTSNSNVVVVTQPENNFPVNSPSLPTSPVSNPSYVTLKDVSSGFSFDSDLVLPIAIGVGGLIVGVIVALVLIPRP